MNDSLNLALQLRDELLHNEKWLTSTEVHERHGGSAAAPGVNSLASGLRKAGELLGVWAGRRYLYPLFQFYPESEGGQLIPEMKLLLQVFPHDPTGWRQAFWLFQRHARLDGERPADVFLKRPLEVIQAAHSTFAASDEYW